MPDTDTKSITNISSLNILQKNLIFFLYSLEQYIKENISKEKIYDTNMKN